MQKLWRVFALIVGITASSCAVAPKVVDNFGNYLLKSSALVEQHPQRSMSCFEIYLPQLTELNENYQRSYEWCEGNAGAARRDVEAAMQANRTEVIDAADEICATFKKCTYGGNSTDFFQCHSTVAGAATKLSYNATNVAKDNLEYINLIYMYIENNEKACFRDADNVYVVSTVRIYEELDACLDGRSLQPQRLGLAAAP